MTAHAFQQEVDDARVVQAIAAAETHTSGEIRVFIRRRACSNPLAEAHRELDRQGMKKTPLRNAILIYLVPTSRVFAIAADEGIHLRCGDRIWNSVAQEMSTLLKEGKFTEAIVAAIQKCGRELARHFPKFPGDRDDLPNTVLRD